MGKSELIGLLMFDLQTRIALAKLEAIDRQVWARGYRTLIRNAAGHPDMEPQLVQEYAGGAVEGLIVVQPTSELTSDSLTSLLSGDFPVVTLEPIEGSGFDCVTVDRRYGAYIAIKHLLDLGHRRIGFLYVDASELHFAPRLAGYKDALGESGIEVDESLLIETRLGYAGGYEAAIRILHTSPRPTALFCDDDEAAIGAMKAIREAGLRIPEDIAVIGFDNIEVGAFAPVSLTTVAQPVEEVASVAVDMLFSRMNEGDSAETKNVSVKPHLVVRESCGGNQGGRFWR